MMRRSHLRLDSVEPSEFMNRVHYCCYRGEGRFLDSDEGHGYIYELIYTYCYPVLLYDTP